LQKKWFNFIIEDSVIFYENKKMESFDELELGRFA